MKRISLKIILAIAMLFMILSLAFHFIYFNKFRNDLRLLKEQDRQKVIDIISKNFSLDEYNISVGKMYEPGKDFVSVELEKNGTKKHYLVDLKKNEIVK